jgi:DNA polymerase III epsilon subunit-like protein
MENRYINLEGTPRGFRRRIDTKSRKLGRTIGKARGAVDSFDPKAIDGDDDGFVQDDSPLFRRPAVPNVGVPAVEKPSTDRGDAPSPTASIGKLSYGVVPSGVLEALVRHQEKDYKLGDVSEIDGKQILPNRADWLKGLTSKQISKLVVPSDEDQMWEMFKNSRLSHISDPAMQKQAKLLFSSALDAPHKQIDFSDSAIAEIRAIVEKAIDESPSFQWAVSNYGMPSFVKRTKSANDAFMDLPEQKIYAADAVAKRPDLENVDVDPPVATTYGNIRTVFISPIDQNKINFGEDGYTTPVGMAVIDDTLGGIVRHEWGHYLHALMSEDDEMPTGKKLLTRKNSYKQKAIAEKYNTEKPLVQNLLSGSSDKSLPWARSAYAHSSMSEMLAEGFSAYLHPNREVKHFAINDVLKKDIEDMLDIDKDESPWDVLPNGLSSGRKRKRKEDTDQMTLDLGKEISKPEETKKPVREPFAPRPPDNGPFTGKFLEIFKGCTTYEEMKQRYESLEVIFFDYETTGLGDDDKPVQLGAVRVRGGKVVERFNLFIKPDRKLSEWSLKNLKDSNGDPLTQEWADSQMSNKEAHAQFIAWAGKNPLLGGQYTPFDLGFLERSLSESGLDFQHAGVIDSKPMADELLPRWSPENPDGPFTERNGKKSASSSLGPVADYLGVDMAGGWHTADVDSETSAEIVNKMFEYGIRNQRAPRQLLDVEGIPKRQDAKKQKYAQEMAQYEKDMAEFLSSQKVDNDTASSLSSGLSVAKQKTKEQSDNQFGDLSPFDLEFLINRGELKDSRQGGLSSGKKVSRNLQAGDLKPEPSTSSSKIRKMSSSEDMWFEVDTWDIGGEKIAFMSEDEFSGEDWGDQDFTKVAINPYEITGYSPDSEEGREFALRWTAAKAVAGGGTRVEALLYAGSRGDEDAMNEFNALADAGEKLIEEARQNRFNGFTPSEERLKQVEFEMNREGVSDLKIEDLYLVHETKYDTEQDKDGNIILRPMGDHEIKGFDGETVDADGKPYEYYRDTIHFTLNHLAQGHMWRQRTDSGTNIIIVPLKDVLDANPDSLDVLFPIDTYLVPKPGEPLRLPNARVVKNKNSETVDKEVADMLKEMGAKKIFTGGESYSTTAQDEATRRLAENLGAAFGAHADIVHSTMEREVSNKRKKMEYAAMYMAMLSDNARMRLANNDRWSGTRIRINSKIDF